MSDKSDFYKARPASRADKLRTLLNQLEDQLPGLSKRDKPGILQYLALLDETLALIEQIKADNGADVTAEAQRFKNVIKAFYHQAPTLFKKLGGSASIQSERPATAQPDTAPWWYLDVYISKKRAKTRNKLLKVSAIILVFVIGLTILFNTILKPNPNAVLKVQQFDSALNLAIQEEDYEGALAEIDIAVAAVPEDIDAHTFRSALLYLLNREEEAEQAFETASSLADRPEDALLAQGQTWWQLQQAELALTAAEKAIELNPQYAEAWFLAGQVYAATDQPAKAYTAFETAGELAFDQENDTLYALARINLGYLTQVPIVPPLTATLTITATPQ